LPVTKNSACSRWVCRGVGGDHRPGQVQGLQQRGEPGDLVGLAVHAGLGEHSAGLLVGYRQQVHSLPVGCGMTGAAHCLTVHGQRPPPAPVMPGPLVSGSQPRAEPGPNCGVERIGVDCFQDPADSGLIRRPEPAGQRVIADSQRGQDLRRRVRDPLADRGERPRPGEHRRRGGQ
jgi:hypothetical protein